MKKRLMALLLVLCMVLGMFPTTVSAADAVSAPFVMKADGVVVDVPASTETENCLGGTVTKLTATVPAGTKEITLSSLDGRENLEVYGGVEEEPIAVQVKECTFDYDPEVAYYCIADNGLSEYCHLYIVEESGAPEPPVAEPKVTINVTGYELGNTGNDVTLTIQDNVTEFRKYSIHTNEVCQSNSKVTTATLEADTDYWLCASFDIKCEDFPELTADDVALAGVDGATFVRFEKLGLPAWQVVYKLPNLGATEPPAEEPKPAELEFGFAVGEKAYVLYEDGTYDASSIGMGDIPAIKVTVPAGTTKGTFTCNHYGMDIWTLGMQQIEGQGGTNKDVSVGENGTAYYVFINNQDLYYVTIAVEEGSGEEPPAAETYDIVISDTANGTVTANAAKATEGETVTLTVEPDDGYVLDTLTYMAEGGTAVDIKEAQSFTMPAAKVTVAAVFKKVETESKVPSTDENGVYQISNYDQLKWFTDYVTNQKNTSANAVLTADIVANENVLNTDGSVNSGSFDAWTPIGNPLAWYTGTFDGQGHTISGIYCSRSEPYIALFGAGDGCTIKNVAVVDSYFSGRNFTAGVIGYAKGNSTVENCGSSATVNGASFGNIGGVIGYAEGNTVVSKCWNTGKVTGGSAVGGVIGCMATTTKVSACWNSGIVSSGFGIAGSSTNSGNSINSCYTLNGTLVSGSHKGTVTNSYYLDAGADGSVANAKTAEQFASGEVTYLLNGESTESVSWYQKLGTDSYPVLNGDSVVYFGYSACKAGYANTALAAEPTSHTFENGICTECGMEESNTEEPPVAEPKVVNINMGSVEAEPGGSVYVPIGVSTDVTDEITKITFTVTTDDGLTLGKMYMTDNGNVSYKCTDMPVVGKITAKPRAVSGQAALPASIDDLVKVQITVPEGTAAGDYNLQCTAEITWVNEPENVDIVYNNGKVTVAGVEEPPAEEPKPAELEFGFAVGEKAYVLYEDGTYDASEWFMGELPAVKVTVPAGTTQGTFTRDDYGMDVWTMDMQQLPGQGGTNMDVSIGENGSTYMVIINSQEFYIVTIAVEEGSGEDAPKPAELEFGFAVGEKAYVLYENGTYDASDWMMGELPAVKVTVPAGTTKGTFTRDDYGMDVWTMDMQQLPGQGGTNMDVSIGENGSTYMVIINSQEFYIVTIAVEEAAAGPKVTVSDTTAAPGANAVFTVRFDNPPADLDYQWSRFVTMFELPEGWEIVNVKEGADVDTTQAGYVPDTPNYGYHGIDNRDMNKVMSGELLIVTVKVPDGTALGDYTVSAKKPSLLNSRWETALTSDKFVLVSGTVTVEKAIEPTKLTAPVLSADNAVVDRTSVTVSVPASTEDPNATVYYAISTDGSSYGDWQTSGKFTGLAEGTNYYIKAYYKTADTVTFIDSDAATLQVTTKVTFIGNAKLTVGEATGYRGDRIEIPVYIEHNFGDRMIDMLQTYFHVGQPNDESMINIVNVKNGSALLKENGSWGFLGNPQWNPDIKDFVYNRIDVTNATFGQGELFIIEAEIAETARDGEYTIIPGVQYNGSKEIHEFNWTFVNGTVTVKTAMTAPVLTDAVAKETMITVTPVSTTEGVKVEYAISADGGETWSEWQESNVFENLEAETDYQIVARYVPVDKNGEYDVSFASEPLKVRTVWPSVTATVGDTKTLGETATVVVSLAHEMDKQATSIAIIPNLPEGVTLKSATAEGFTVNVVNGEINIYQNTAFTVPVGDLVTLTLVVPTVGGDYAVSLEEVVFFNEENEIGTHVSVEAGTVHVHKAETVKGQEATCTEPGLTDGTVCSLCDETIKAQENIDAKGHKYESKVTEPTCLTAGYTTFTCECGDTYYDEIKAANGHELKKTVTDPTHEKMGYTTYKCENCDFAYVSDWTDAIDHKYEKTVSKAATCTEDGEWTFKCECGDTYTQVMPKNGHSCEAAVTAPTCEDMGYTTYECKNCDFSYINDLKDALGHKETVVGKKEATVEAEGYTGDTVCSVCETVLVKGEVIAKLEPSECICAPFTDVDTNAWYHEAVDFVLEAKLMHGTSGTTFAPQANTNRAMMAVLLYRLEGEPSVAGMENPFEDVPADTWYTDAVIWAANEGVVKGTSTTTFTPNQEITREQMVAMLWRYAGEPEADEAALKDFTDAATVSNYAKEAMAWAIETGLVSGMTKTTIAPEGTANRAQIATILMRYASK